MLKYSLTEIRKEKKKKKKKRQELVWVPESRLPAPKDQFK
jgi:hypothetical protein